MTSDHETVGLSKEKAQEQESSQLSDWLQEFVADQKCYLNEIMKVQRKIFDNELC